LGTRDGPFTNWSPHACRSGALFSGLRHFAAKSFYNSSSLQLGVLSGCPRPARS
jgi:hypothetical protein